MINPYHLRSALFVPSLKEGYMDKVATIQDPDRPDSIIFDLEDSISPEYKDEAREVLEKRLGLDGQYRQNLQEKYQVSVVRVNHESTPWFEKDMEAVANIAPDMVMMAKVEEAQEIERVRDFLKSEQVPSQLIVPIESMAGYKKRESILDMVRPEDLFVVGYEDLSGELNIDRPEDMSLANPVTHILMECLIEAQQREIVMWDAVCRKYSTEDSLEHLSKECDFAKRLGLQGKIAIHPNQVREINRRFDKKVALSKARNIIDRFKAKEDGVWVIENEQGEMEDTPSLARAERTLKFWQRI